jgi:cell division protein FtsQ
MRLSKGKIWKISKTTLLVALLFGSIGFVEKQYQRRTCTSIEVSIANQFENYFINEGDVIEIITDRGENRIIGASLDALDLKFIEQQLYANKFIKRAEVFKDLSGHLMINIDQSRPIARLMSNKMSDRYISNIG